MLNNVYHYIKGILIDLAYCSLGNLGSFLFGLIVSTIRHYRITVLVQVETVYIELSRNTPVLIQLFFLYSVFPESILSYLQKSVQRLGLSFRRLLSGRIFPKSAGSHQSNPAGDWPRYWSDTSTGLSLCGSSSSNSGGTSSFSANVIFLIKDTSFFSAVALADLMYVAKDLICLYYETDIALAMCVVAYLIMLLPISLVFSWIERRLRHAGFGNPSTLSRK